MRKEVTSFPEHRFDQKRIIFGIQFAIGRGEFDVAEVEPLSGKVFDETLDLGVTHHAFGFRLADFRIA